jgi:D-lactate dehydrogenase
MTQSSSLRANVNAAHEFPNEEKLSPHTAKLAEGNADICAFVNDVLNARVLDILQSQNIRMIALRCAGFNQVDLRHASALGIKVAHVAAYSPDAVAAWWKTWCIPSTAARG